MTFPFRLPNGFPTVLLLALACCLASAQAAVYHLDSIHGDDSSSGLSPALAWRSLEKANATELKPGDQLLFKAGGRWSGQLAPKGGGDSKERVVIGRYGEGPLPRIDGEGKFLNTLLLKNISFIEVADLEITNLGPKSVPWRTGVTVLADGIGKMQRVHIHRLHVHDVNGDLRKTHEGCGIFFEAKGDTLIQFNEVSGTKGTKDGQGFDADYNCRRSIFQYNYSHHNEGGFILVCGPETSVNETPVIRYNISVHDGIDSARVFHFGGKSTNALVHNNTIIIGAHQDLPMILQTQWQGGISENARFANNLFIVEPGGRATYDFTHSKMNLFESNLFCGRHEGLPTGASVSPTPNLAGSVKPAPGFASLQGCRPADAKTFPRGILIKDNGGRDFFGNPVPADRPAAIGAAEK